MKVKVFTQIATVLVVGVVVSACGRDKICDCIDAGEALNKKSHEILKNETVSEAEKKTVLELKKVKEEKCHEFQTMSGPEMLKRKASCK